MFVNDTHRAGLRRLLCFITAWAAVIAAPIVLSRAAMPEPAETAAQIDRLLLAADTDSARAKDSASTKDKDSVSSSTRCDDVTFLRRASLDVVGDLPTPEAITAQVLDPAADKRQRLVDELLANPHYGQNWARYWRDVILYRRLEDRALFVANSLVVDLTKALNDDTGWDEIVRKFITATGDVREDGYTAVITAQDGKSEETTAEMARIFLGMQIQCSQCHDDFSGRWKREQFHELAAFFPRIALRPVRSPVKRSLEVAADDRFPRRQRRPNANGRRGSAEHYMPDLDNPTAAGTLMTPKFFLTGDSMELGAKDSERRGTVARWITDNPWFAKSQVNRVWAELVGRGFYEPIDDLGPDRQCSNPAALDLLASDFARSGYRMKWLVKTILLTSAYQSAQLESVDAESLAANRPQRLRADQLYNRVTTSLKIPEQTPDRRRERPQPYGGQRGARGVFIQTFGYDPSGPRDEVTGSIPQALALMNSPQINGQINGRNSRTLLGKLLRETDDPETIVEELYLRVLARQPSRDELQKCLSYVNGRPQEVEGFEDVLWALMNSAEMLYRN